MGLDDVVHEVDRRETTLTVLDPDPDDPVVDELASFFADRAVEICADTTPSGRPTDVAVLERDGELLSTAAVDTLRDQRERYVDLADGGLDVSIYVTPDEPVPSVPGASVRVLDDPDVRDFRVVAFDRGGAG